jgi:hypothetical protein
LELGGGSNKKLEKKCIMKSFICSLCSLPDINRIINQGEFNVAYMGGKRNACRVLVGKTEGEIPVGTLRRRCKEYVEKDTRCESVELTHLAQNKDKSRGCQHSTETLGY